MVENRTLDRTTGRAEGPGATTGAAGGIGSPVALGLVAFSTSAFTLGSVLAHWWSDPTGDLMLLVPALLVFGGIAQFVAAMWSYARGSTLTATFLGSFGSLFAIVAFGGLLAGAGRVSLGAGSSAFGPLGVLVGCFGFIALIVAAGIWKESLGLALTSLAMAIALFFAAWSLFAAGDLLLAQIGGWLGVVTGILGFATAATTALGLGLDRPMAIPRLGVFRAA